MRKNLLTLLFAAATTFCGMAEGSVLEFTYAEGELSAFGKAKKETIDVAMCIDNPSYAGRKLTGFKAYINTSENLSNTSLWLSKALTLENKQNVPDIASYEVTPTDVSLGGVPLKELSVSLKEPYILTEEPVYLGYTLTVNALESYEDRYPLIISAGVNPNGFFLHGTNSVLKWMEYSTTSGGVAYIVANLEGDYADYSLDMKNYKEIYAEESDNFNVEFTVLNSGINPVNFLSYTYTVDDGELIPGELVELDMPIEPSLSISSEITLPFKGITGIGPHNLKVNVVEVNGYTNESNEATIDCVVNVIPFVPVHRPLVEEITGLWCQWCPKGYIAMEMIAEQYPDSQVSVCYHNNDVMEVTNVYPYELEGLPASSIDRIPAIDPYYGTYDESVQFGISLDLQDAMAKLSIASIDVAAQLEGDVVKVNSSVRFIKDISDGNYQIGYVLVCNGLTDETWAQANSFPTVSGLEGTPLEVLTTWPRRVYGLVFNDVAVDVSAYMGIPGSLPSDIVTNKEYTNDFSFNISGNELVQNRENLVVAAFIVDKATGGIVNANKYAFKSGTVHSVTSNSEVVSREYYDLTGHKISQPSKGIFILKENYSDGSSTTKKIYK